MSADSGYNQATGTGVFERRLRKKKHRPLFVKNKEQEPGERQDSLLLYDGVVCSSVGVSDYFSCMLMLHSESILLLLVLLWLSYN